MICLHPFYFILFQDKELKDFDDTEKVHAENEIGGGAVTSGMSAATSGKTAATSGIAAASSDLAVATSNSGIAATASSTTIADTIDLTDTDGNSKVLSETLILDPETKEIIIEQDVNAQGMEKPAPEPKKEYQGKKSKASASLKFKTVWFNFAAPPKTPISKKIDFTKLDWNLLSTGSPGIDAWLNPVNR